VLQCVAVCCSVLQCVAVHCSALQCVAVCCSVLQYATMSPIPRSSRLVRIRSGNRWLVLCIARSLLQKSPIKMGSFEKETNWLLKLLVLFCKGAAQKLGSFEKETWRLRDPTDHHFLFLFCKRAPKEFGSFEKDGIFWKRDVMISRFFESSGPFFKRAEFFWRSFAKET